MKSFFQSILNIFKNYHGTDRPLVITISDFHETQTYKFSPKVFKALKFFTIFLLIYFISTSLGVSILSFKYFEHQNFLENNKDIIALKEQIAKENAIHERNKNKKVLEFKDLSPSSKNLLLKLMPFGNPFQEKHDIVSQFGMRDHPIYHSEKLHKGLDFRAAIGTNVISPATGIVTYANRKGGYGLFIEIEHSFGFKTHYAHLNKLNVKEGDIISRNQVIALSGNTGNSTGPHLHYEILFKEEEVNPLHFLESNENSLTEVFKNNQNIQWESLKKVIVNTGKLKT